MSFEEYRYWCAFNLIEPIGCIREDAMFAGVAKTIADANVPKHDLTLNDLMIFNKHQDQTLSKADNQAAVKAKLDSLVVKKQVEHST